MAIRIQVRRDNAATWSAANPVLAEGETGYELDTGFSKIGNGATAWNSLAYISGGGGGGGDVVGPTSSTDKAVARFNLLTGKLLQDSLVVIADDGAIIAPQASSVIPFYFANQAAFPSPSSVHGAIAHSHSDGKMFFAHAGAWVRLADYSEIGSGGSSADAFHPFLLGGM